MAIGEQSLQEYLVSLGVKVDDRGFGKFASVLKSSKAAVMGITGAMAAMAVGIMKASQSITDAAVKYEDMGRKAGKSASEIAKQEIALQAMGKTLQEVNKNERLKKTYEDLKKLGGEIGLPKAGEGRKQITGIGEELSKLKVTAIYAMQWINEEFLNRLAAPLAELRKSLKELREKIMEHLPKISQKVGGFFAGFIRLIGAGVKGVADLAKWIGGLPDVVLKAIGAFAGMWVILKASPIFWILGGLTALLLLLDDFYTYKRGGQSALPGLWDGIEKGNLGDTVFGALEKSLEGFDKKLDNFLNIGEQVAGKILEGITTFDFTGSGAKAGTFIQNLLKKLLGIVNGEDKDDTNLATTIADILLKLGTGIGQWLVGAINSIDWAGLGLSLGGMVTSLFTWLSDTLSKTGEEGGIISTAGTLLESIANAIGGVIIGALDGIDWNKVANSASGTAEKIWSGIGRALFGGPKKRDWRGHVTQEETKGILGTVTDLARGVFDSTSKALGEIRWGDVGDSIANMVNGLFDGVTTSLKGSGGVIVKAGEVLEGFANAIGDLIIGAISGIKWGDAVEKTTGTAESIWSGISRAIFGGPKIRDWRGHVTQKETRGILGTANDVVSGILESIADAFKSINWSNAGASAGRMVREFFSGIGKMLTAENGKKDKNIFKSMFDVASSLVGGLLDAIASFFQTVSGEEVADSISNMVTSIFNMFNDSFGEEEGGKSIGQKIGDAIGNAIRFTGGLLVRLAQNLLEMFNNGEAGESFVQIGGKIAEDIIVGIARGLGDVFGALITGRPVSEIRAIREAYEGKQGWGYDPKTNTTYTDVQMEQMESENPEKAEEIKEAGMDAVAALQEVKAKYPWIYKTHGGNEAERMKEYANFMTDSPQYPGGTFKKVSEEWTQLIEARKKAFESQDFEMYMYLTRGVSAYIKKYQEGYGWAEYLTNSGKNQGAADELARQYLNLEAEVNVTIDPTSLTSQITKTVSEMPPVVVPTTTEIPATHGKWDAVGGRYSSPRTTTVSEHGQTEYIIPLNKPERARGLILQMFAEMGSGARGILDALGVRGGGGRGPSFSGIDSRLAMAGAYASGGGGYMKQNSDNTVTASPIINVYGSSDPVMTGRVAYDAAEQSLMRHIRGVLGQ